MNEKLKRAIEHWDAIAPLVQKPKNDKDYQTLLTQLEEALKLAGEDENNALNPLIDSMARALQQYEDEVMVNDVGGGVTALKYLMKVHGVKQSDLKEVGSQGVVSEIINGKRSLTVRHIKALAKRFDVSPTTFIDH